MALDVLAGAGGDDHAAPALIAGDRVVVRDELAALVADRRRQLGRQSRLVLLQGGNDLELVVTYLAARQGRHPVVLSAPEASAALIDRYRPDVVVSTAGSGIELAVGHISKCHLDAEQLSQPYVPTEEEIAAPVVVD